MDVVRTGSAPVYARRYHVARDLPFYAYALITMTALLFVGFGVALLSAVMHRRNLAFFCGMSAGKIFIQMQYAYARACAVTRSCITAYLGGHFSKCVVEICQPVFSEVIVLSMGFMRCGNCKGFTLPAEGFEEALRTVAAMVACRCRPPIDATLRNRNVPSRPALFAWQWLACLLLAACCLVLGAWCLVLGACCFVLAVLIALLLGCFAPRPAPPLFLVRSWGGLPKFTWKQ